MKINISLVIEFENQNKVIVSGMGMESVGVLYPRQVKFIHELNQIIKEYIKTAPESDKD